MKMEVMLSTEELGNEDYKPTAMPGVYIHPGLGRVLVFSGDDTGIMINMGSELANIDATKPHILAKKGICCPVVECSCPGPCADML